jgi:F420-0:gamma-glutamyl ligase
MICSHSGVDPSEAMHGVQVLVPEDSLCSSSQHQIHGNKTGGK